MGYIIGYEVHCPSCRADITNNVVFIEHELYARCPSCGAAARYPLGIHPRNMPVKNGRHECDKCGRLTDFARQWGSSWEQRCTSCMLEDATQFLEGHAHPSSAEDVRIMGAVALAVGVPLAALTVVLALIETGWFVMTGLIALPLLALAGYYLLRAGKVAAGTAEHAERSKELLDRLGDDELTDVDKLALIGLTPGGLWTGKYPGDILNDRPAPAHP
jgi:transposase-like protein